MLFSKFELRQALQIVSELYLSDLYGDQSCAATLAQHPDKFKVTVIERAPVTGGQATSISLDKSKYGTDWMNSKAPSFLSFSNIIP